LFSFYGQIFFKKKPISDEIKKQRSGMAMRYRHSVDVQLQRAATNN
jgi:hypothetical protein